MKKLLLTAALLPVLLLFSGCCFYGNCEEEEPWESQFSPVVMSRSELEASVSIKPQQPILKSGKIYIKDNMMFINDVNKGFHVYNYANSQSPLKIGFIKIPGATDLAIRNNIIYINQAVDLVTITYDPAINAISSLHRNRNVFPPKVSPDGSTSFPQDGEIIIDWTLN